MPPETTVTFAVIGDVVVLPIVIPMIVVCVPAGVTYALAAVVVAFFRKEFLKLFAIFLVLYPVNLAQLKKQQPGL